MEVVAPCLFEYFETMLQFSSQDEYLFKDMILWARYCCMHWGYSMNKTQKSSLWPNIKKQVCVLLFNCWVVSASFATPWTIAHQTPLFMGFFWRVAIFFFRDLPDPGTEPTSPALAGRFFTTEPPGRQGVRWERTSYSPGFCCDMESSQAECWSDMIWQMKLRKMLSVMIIVFWWLEILVPSVKVTFHCRVEGS